MTSQQQSEDDLGDAGTFAVSASTVGVQKKVPSLSQAALRRQPKPPAAASGSSHRISTYRSRPSVRGVGAGTTSSQTAESEYNPVPRLENSYRIVPKDDEIFNVSVVKHVVQNVMDQYLKGVRYDPETCRSLSKKLTEVIKDKVKEINFPRYKYICNVTLGQNLDQGLSFTSRSIWNSTTDNFVTVTSKNNNMFAVATLFATYYE